MQRTIIAALVLFASATRGMAGDTPMDRATLRGIKALKVVADRTGPDLERAGLTAASLQSQVEEKLRNAGVPIDGKAIEFIAVRALAAHDRRTPYALCLSLGVYQIVSLARDAAVKTSTETWGSESVLIIPPQQLSRATAESVDALLNQFLEAYRSANPK